MRDVRYRIIFSGKITDGYNTEEVAKKLAAMFNLKMDNHEHTAKLAKLMSPWPVVVKQDLTRQAALKYREALASAGAICSIQNMDEAWEITLPHKERRKEQRRKFRDRRGSRRSSAIMPDRRRKPGNRITDIPFEG